jgi:hypothetical protein
MRDLSEQAPGATTSQRGRRVRRLLLALIPLALVGALVSLIMRSQELPNHAVEPIWDGDVCAHCSMHLSDPRFAAQVQTQDGQVLHFDDPGCAVLLLAEEQPAVHALYFHDHDSGQWLTSQQVMFRPVAESPMGFGYAATSIIDAEGAIDMDTLSERILGGAPVSQGGDQ